MSKVYIKDLKDASYQGKDVTDFFALRKKELKAKDADSKPYLSLEIGDATGRMDAVLWNDAAEVFKRVDQGDVVQLKGLVGTFRDAPQVKVEVMRRAEASEYSLEDFLPSSKLSLAGREAAIRSEIVTVKEPYLMRLLELFFDNREFMKAFLAAPAAKLWHHPYIGGLSEHTAAVCRLARGAINIYELLDRDLLIAGCLLHDIGKIREYQVGTFIDFSDEGRLAGHIVIGDRMLTERIAQIREFPAETAKRLSHMIISHHGERDKGSPVPPATLEALVLHHCDYLDSHAAAFTRIIKREGAQNKRWSDYVNLIDRYIYLAGRAEESGQEEELRLL